MLSYVQAIVIALVQGVTELFPVSSLGHSVLVPAWLGGSWETLVTQSSQAHSESSFYLAFIVALHVATALALLWFFRADWIRIIASFAAPYAVCARVRCCSRPACSNCRASSAAPASTSMARSSSGCWSAALLRTSRCASWCATSRPIACDRLPCAAYRRRGQPGALCGALACAVPG